MAKQKNKGISRENTQFWGRELEYIMPRQTFNDLTKEVKGDKFQYVMDYINETYGLLGHVTSLVLEDAPISATHSVLLEDVMPA